MKKQNSLLKLEEALRALITEEKEKRNKEERFLLESPSLISEISIRDNPYPFKAIYILGPAGAGKSYVSKNMLGIPMKKFFNTNSDEIVEDVFQRFGMSARFLSKGDIAAKQQAGRQIAQTAATRRGAQWIGRGYPLIFDTTGEDADKIIGRMDNLREMGYQIGVFLVNVPTEVSVERDLKRCRSVDPETGNRTRNISRQYQDNVDKYVSWVSKQEDNEIVLFGGDVFNNIYCLSDRCIVPEPDCRSALVKDPRTGQFVVDKKIYKQQMEDAIERAKQNPAAFGEYLPGIEPGKRDKEGKLPSGTTMPEGWDKGGPERAKKIVERGKQQVQSFLRQPPSEKAKIYIDGMSAMTGIPQLSGIAQSLVAISKNIKKVVDTKVREGEEEVSAASLPPIKALLEALTDVDIDAMITKSFKKVADKPEGGGEAIPGESGRFGRYAGTAQTVRDLTDADYRE